MDKDYYSKYSKYKYKYFNLLTKIENLNNLEGGAQKFKNQIKLTYMLKINNEEIKKNILDRYEEIKKYICSVESQNPHFTLFEIIINGDNSKVQEYINDIYNENKINIKTPANAINYNFGKLKRDNNFLNKFKVNYVRGVDNYTVFENDEKYFFAKEFDIDEETKKSINSVSEKIIEKLKNIFANNNTNYRSNTIEFNSKHITLYKYNGEEIFYYNNLYINMERLHITIAKISKTNLENILNIFNSSNIDPKNYFLTQCTKIISNAQFPRLIPLNYITKEILEINISTQQKSENITPGLKMYY